MELLYLDISHEGQAQTSKIITVYKDLIQKYPGLPTLKNVPAGKKISQQAIGFGEPKIDRFPDILFKTNSEEYVLFEADDKYSDILRHLADLRIYGIYEGSKELKITEYNIIWFFGSPQKNWEGNFHPEELKKWKKLLEDILPKSVKRSNIYFFGENEFKYEIIKVK